MSGTVESGPLLLFPTHYLGNFVLGLPWLCEIAAHHLNVTIVIDSAFAPLLDMTPAKSARVIEYPRAKLAKSNSVFSRAKHYTRFLAQLRQQNHSCLIDLEGERFTGVLSLLSGCSVRYGPTQKNSSRFYTSALNLDYENHRFNAFGELIEQWQHIQTPSNLVQYQSTASDNKLVQDLVKEHENIVIIHPGASARFKRWPIANFAELSDLLTGAGYSIVWIGAGESDAIAVEEISALCSQDQAINLCNRLSFAQLIALLKIGTLYIGADSGPMHLAASTGLPLLGLFGPSKESIWKPLGRNSKVLRSPLRCNTDCRGTVCSRETHCLESLTPLHVLESALTNNPIEDSKTGIQ